MKRIFSLIIISLFLINFDLTTGQSVWQSIGPYGGYIRCLTKDNQGRIIAGNAYGGIFRTSYVGQNWEQIFTGFRNEDVRSLAVNSDNHIFAGTDGHGLYRSTDDGNTWQRLNNSIYTSTVMAILIISSGDIFVGTFNGLYKSTNNGTTFTSSGNGITGSTIRALGSSSGYLFAGSDFSGVFRSSNNGTSWEAVNNGIDFNGRLVECFASTDFISDGANNIYVGVSDKMYRSSNIGINWDELPTPQKNFSDLLIRSNGNIVASASSNVTSAGGGVIQSTDQGNNWQIFNVDNVPFTSVEEDNNGGLIAGSQGPGTYATVNDIDWNLEVNNMPAVAITGMNSTAGLITVATKHSGSFVSTDEGESWETASRNIPYGWNYSFRKNPATNSTYLLHQNGTFKTNYGDWNNWTNTNILANTLGFNSLGHTFLFSGAYCYRSTDDGNNFQPINIGSISYTRQVAFDHEDNIYISTANDNGFFGNGVWYSSNNGDNWLNITNNAPLNITSIEKVDTTGFLPLPDCLKEIMAGTGDGRYFTLNDNFTWNEFNLNLSSTLIIKDISSLNYSSGIKTTFVTEQEIVSVYENSCASIEQDKPEDIAAVFYGTWLRFPFQDLPAEIVEMLGTNGSGIFLRDLSTDVEQEDYFVPEDYILSQNYPNPFNPTTTIQFSLPEQTFVKLEVFNTLGEKVTTLISEELSAGSYKYDWNAANLPSGTYLYKLQTKSFSQSKKMTLIK